MCETCESSTKRMFVCWQILASELFWAAMIVFAYQASRAFGYDRDDSIVVFLLAISLIVTVFFNRHSVVWRQKTAAMRFLGPRGNPKAVCWTLVVFVWMSCVELPGDKLFFAYLFSALFLLFGSFIYGAIGNNETVDVKQKGSPVGPWIIGAITLVLMALILSYEARDFVANQLSPVADALRHMG